MSKHPKTEFDLLKDEWYQKLKDDGFDDVEQDENKLKKWSSGSNRFHGEPLNWEAKATYYQMASSFLEEYKFATKREQIIWEYHANGLSTREIAKTLNKLRTQKTRHDIIANVINKLKVKMYCMYMEPKEDYHE